MRRSIFSSRLPFKPSFFYGWMIVGVSALTLFFSGPGQTHSVSFFIDSYIQEFGWSRSAVSAMYSIGTLTAGIFMGAIGNLFDKKGHRKMTTIIALLFGISCFGMSQVKSLPMLLMGFFSIRLFGQGSMELSSNTLVPQWFINKKGQALSLVSLGGAASSALLPLLNTWIIQSYGWRIGWHFWTVLLWFVMAPISLIFIRDKPEEVGLQPDNQEIKPSENIQGETNILNDWTVSKTLRTKSFWLILYSMIVPSTIMTGIIFHQVSIMNQAGLGPEVAAMVLSILSLVRLPVVLVAGQIADRFPSRYLLATSLGILFVAILFLRFTNSLIMAIVYGVLLGFLTAILGLVRGVIWPEYYGRSYLSSIRGVAMMAGIIGSALGPLLFGYAYDKFGSYNGAILISIILSGLGILSALLAKHPKKKISYIE